MPQMNAHSGTQLDVPCTVTTGQLETLLNGLLANEEKLPYAFQLEDQVRAKRTQYLQA
jgi:hypothetical protein